MNLFGGMINTLEQSLKFATAKNHTISNNIANVDTPNYKANDVQFKDVLNNSLSSSLSAKKTNESHIPFSNELNIPFQKTKKNNTLYNHNGNNVDIDSEMADLAKNQIYYQSIIDRLNGKLGNIQTVIRGGS